MRCGPRPGRRPHRWLIAAVACGWLGVLPAGAAELPAFQAAVETALSHGRVALDHLQRDEPVAAATAIAAMRHAWTGVVQRFGGDRPAVFTDRTRYVVTFTDVSTRLVTADLMLHTGRPQIAADALVAIRDELSALRRSAGLYERADCVLDAHRAWSALDAAAPHRGPALAGLAAAYGDVLQRCDTTSPAGADDGAAFRDLLRQARAALAALPAAISARDDAMLQRMLVTLRDLDRRLTTRYG